MLRMLLIGVVLWAVSLLPFWALVAGGSERKTGRCDE